METTIQITTEATTQATITRRKALSLIMLGTSAALLQACGAVKTSYNRANYQSSGNVRKGSLVANTVKSQLGVRYVLGGESPREGFDCSGLLYWAYMQHGIKIPRVTKDQAYAGNIAPLHDLNPGDILVFAQSSAPNSLHTGMYIGNNTFIHSPNSRSRVREESMTNKYWKSSLVLARRFV